MSSGKKTSAPPVFDAIREQNSTQYRAAFATMFRYLWPKNRLDLRIKVVAASLSLLVAKLINVYVPFLYKSAVDTLSLPANLVTIPLLVILSYGAARVMSQFFGEVRDTLFAWVARHAQRRIALETFEHLHQLSLAFHLDRQTGGLSRAIERGTHGIEFVLNFMVFNILPTLLEIGMVTAILWWRFDYRFALVTFLTIVVYILFTLRFTDWRVRFRRNMNEADSEANTKAIDSLLNYETVKYFGNEVHETQRFDRALAGYEKAAVQSQATLSLLNLGQGVLIGVGLVGVMYLAAAGVAAGNMTAGDFVLVNTFLIQLYLPLNFLGFVYREVKQGLVDMDKMFSLRAISPDVRDLPGAPSLSVQQGQVEFRGVSFSYRPERQILHDVSFKVPAGKVVAIVGPTGSGKSTIGRVLFRFYDVESGQILIDDQDISTCQQASVRACLGIVPQDTVLFNDTILYNIQYGRPSASQEEIVEAARLASIHDFVESLPDGYQTRVGERGLKLSGGEKQRVAIARAILKNPKILLFDEATSALDSVTEKEIQQSLRKVARNRTTLVIAHRLSTIVDADEILVLDEGRIVERGTHQTLLQKGGEYAQLWEKQRSTQNTKGDTHEPT